MEPSNSLENSNVLTKKQNTRWLLWVDDEIKGYACTLEDAQGFLSKISSDISNDLERARPELTINCENIEDNIVKINCLNSGYVYNSLWTEHTVRYEPVYKLIGDNTESPRKRAPSFDTIQNDEKTSKPETRPPTPRPEEKEALASTANIPNPPPPPDTSKNTVSSSSSRRKLKKKRKCSK